MLELAELLDVVIKIFSLLILIRVLLSWVPVDHPTVRNINQVLNQVTAPIIDPIRRVMPPVGGLDLSPLVAMLLLGLVGGLLREVLLTLGP